MADAGKETAPAVTSEPTEPPAPSPNASVLVKCGHPTSRFFAGDDVPVIDKHGVKLTKEQTKKAQEAAERAGVRLIVEGEGK